MPAGGSRSPEVSVIVPVKDTPPWLLIRAVLSVVHQRGDHGVEVVVWDDGSTDRACRATLDRLAQISGVVVGGTLENRGISAARNAACRKASGEWYLWLDSDDELPSTAVTTLLGAARRDTLYVIGQCEVHLPGGSVVRHGNDTLLALWRRFPYGLANPLLSAVFAVHGGMVRRTLFEEVRGFDENLRYAELTDWFLRTMAAVWPQETAVVQLITYRYHKRVDSHSADREALEEYRLLALDRYAEAMGWPKWKRRFGARCTTTGARRYDLVDDEGTIRVKATDEYEDYCPTERLSLVSDRWGPADGGTAEGDRHGLLVAEPEVVEAIAP